MIAKNQKRSAESCALKAARAALCVLVAALSPACARHYTAHGLVIAANTTASTATISHDAFPGFMDAMVMPFDLKGSARRVALTPGDRVQLRLSVKGRSSWIDRLEVVSAAPIDAGLQQTPAVPVLVPVGSPIPPFELVDHTGHPLTLASLKGKVVAVTFIYTRCPLPDYCPRMTENFRAVRDRFASRMDRDLVLLTISFDPQYDTPERLTAYARANRVLTPGWYFLTGDAAKIEQVCNAFGIQYWAEEGLITHSLETAVVDRDGRLAGTVEGKAFTPKQLGDLVEAVLNR